MEKHWPNVPKLVKKMFDAQNGNCGYCGVPMFIKSEVPLQYYNANKKMVATFEHITPRSKGGYYTLENGAACCNQCNTMRGNMPLEVFFDNFDEILTYYLSSSSRAKAKKEMNTRKNGYIVAWFAKHTNQTVEDLFLSFSAQNSYDMARTL